MSTPPLLSPSPDEQAAALYVPHRGSISESASIEEVEEVDTRETPPPMYDGVPIRYLNEGDDGFDEIRSAIDLINESDSPDDEPPENDPPVMALRFPVPEDEDEDENSEPDALRPTG